MEKWRVNFQTWHEQYCLAVHIFATKSNIIWVMLHMSDVDRNYPYIYLTMYSTYIYHENCVVLNLSFQRKHLYNFLWSVYPSVTEKYVLKTLDLMTCERFYFNTNMVNIIICRSHRLVSVRHFLRFQGSIIGFFIAIGFSRWGNWRRIGFS